MIRLLPALQSVSNLLGLLLLTDRTSGLPQSGSIFERNWSYDLNKDASMTVTVFDDPDCAATSTTVNLVWGGNMAIDAPFKSYELSRTMAQGWGDPRGLEQLDFSFGNADGVYPGCGQFTQAVGGYGGAGFWPTPGTCENLDKQATCMSLRKYFPPKGSTITSN